MLKLPFYTACACFAIEIYLYGDIITKPISCLIFLLRYLVAHFHCVLLLLIF